MGVTSSTWLYRRRAFWLLVTACLTLMVLGAWGVVRATPLVKGPSVVLPGSGFDAVAISRDGRTLYAADEGPGGDLSGHTVTPLDIACLQGG